VKGRDLIQGGEGLLGGSGGGPKRNGEKLGYKAARGTADTPPGTDNQDFCDSIRTYRVDYLRTVLTRSCPLGGGKKKLVGR